jgi:hypothetical protein
MLQMLQPSRAPRQGPPSAARVGAPPRSPIGERRPRTYVPLCRLPASHVICSLLG